jgi:hypothetical protein
VSVSSPAWYNRIMLDIFFCTSPIIGGGIVYLLSRAFWSGKE